MVQPRREPRLAQEHLPEVVVAGEALPEDLDDDKFLETARAFGDGEVHVGRPALPQRQHNPIFPNGLDGAQFPAQSQHFAPAV